jgi:KaiC/GvpD/RAD55 family RecA-like ATPase
MAKPRVLRFGIQSLDRLIGTVKSDADNEVVHGIDVTDPEESSGGRPKGLPITSSICLAGPDGTGKSVLSLHLVSTYLADCVAECLETKKACPDVKVLHISTDLTYKMALKGWKHFALDTPFKRKEPLVELREGRRRPVNPEITITLEQYYASGGGGAAKGIVKYLEDYCPIKDGQFKPEVCFVDLASSTAGDDWGFVHRLLSTLDDANTGEPRHLVVLDAVEGFETLVGERNAFGEKSSRRARIAQAMRLASAKSHLVLVVEEGRQQRFPEEFVTDVVIRLRNINTGRYMRRTVEIEKARGQSHKRGQHPYVLRDGTGSTTGRQINADDPPVPLADGKTPQSYIHVFASLDFHSREIMIDRNVPPPASSKTRFAAFGLPYLDNMLAGRGEKAERDADGGSDTRGLPCGSATALIGDPLTQKSQLGRAFLSRAFFPFVEDLRAETFKVSEAQHVNDWTRQVEDGVSRIARREQSASADHVARKIIETVTQVVDGVRERFTADSKQRYPVAVLFTTHDTNVEGLANDFYQWFREEDGLVRDSDATESIERRLEQVEENRGEKFQSLITSEIGQFASQYEKHVIKRKQSETSFREGEDYIKHRDRFKHALVEWALELAVKKHIREHTICRRFEIHDLPGPVLMNIFQRSIEKAQRTMLRLLDEELLPDRPTRVKESWRIRVVIDDLNAFRNTYPEIRDDPLMLPSLFFQFAREGVTSLIVDTQASGSPELSITERFDSSVRELVQTRIYVWRLPFYGENRVAISVIPPISHDYRGLIRELRWENKNESRTDRALTVDPHFELYTGLERAQPQPVPLEVRLYCDSPSVARYIAREERILSEIFTPIFRPNSDARVIVPAQLNEYEPLRDACHIQRDTRLDHTTILQVNEFWWLRRPRQRRAGAFRPQWTYLNSVTATSRRSKFCSEPTVDPFWVYQPRPSEESEAADSQNESNNGQSRAAEKRKRDFFDEDCGYGLRTIKDTDTEYVDRVPYTWDFGFLLCNGKAWEEALALDTVKNTDPGIRPGKSVAQIWNSLRKAIDNNPSEEVSWRDFLAASKLVADFQSFRTSTKSSAFDFTMLIPESFSCLILEMWFSEAYNSLRQYERTSKDPAKRQRLKKQRDLLKRVGRRQWYSDTGSPLTLLNGLRKEQGQKLQSILDRRTTERDVQCFSLELYKVWLLLTQALSFEDLVDSSSHLNFEFKSKDVSSNAVSARHWYKTASSFVDSLTPEQVEYNWVPVRLPGNFSVRADWFLAVGGGSRSSRLADHALDLLSSQRANVTRLQEGIGLPTRRLFDNSYQHSHLRTRLVSAQKGTALKNVEYHSLRRIGAQTDPGDEEFFWLWRSGIWAYNRHSRIWHKWLNRALLWWHSWHQRYGSNWANGFEVYDVLSDIEFSDDKKLVAKSRERLEALKLETWDKFDELRDILISELEQVSISTG